MDVPQAGGKQEESLRRMRMALGNPHGTGSEKRERLLSAWKSLKSVANSADAVTNAPRSHEKRNKHQSSDAVKRKDKKARGQDTERSVEAMREEKDSQLHEAARLGQADRVRELIGRGSKVSSKDSSGNTSLHWASLYGHTEVVRVLLGLGAADGKRVNRQNGVGNTALHYACIGHHSQVATMLQLYKPDEYRTNVCGQTPVSLGLRELVESVRRAQRLDDVQAARNQARHFQLLETSDWHVGRDAGNANTDETLQKSLRGYWRSWEDYEKAWRKFIAKFTRIIEDDGESSKDIFTETRVSAVGDTIYFKDVPWPVTEIQVLTGHRIHGDQNEGESGLLLAELGVSGADLRSRLQQERLRWHPDKFMQMFGRHLSSEDRSVVLAGVQTVCQLLNSLAEEITETTQ